MQSKILENLLFRIGVLIGMWQQNYVFYLLTKSFILYFYMRLLKWFSLSTNKIGFMTKNGNEKENKYSNDLSKVNASAEKAIWSIDKENISLCIYLPCCYLHRCTANQCNESGSYQYIFKIWNGRYSRYSAHKRRQSWNTLSSCMELTKPAVSLMFMMNN